MKSVTNLNRYRKNKTAISEIKDIILSFSKLKKDIPAVIGSRVLNIIHENYCGFTHDLDFSTSVKDGDIIEQSLVFFEEDITLFTITYEKITTSIQKVIYPEECLNFDYFLNAYPPKFKDDFLFTVIPFEIIKLFQLNSRFDEFYINEEGMGIYRSVFLEGTKINVVVNFKGMEQVEKIVLGD